MSQTEFLANDTDSISIHSSEADDKITNEKSVNLLPADKESLGVLFDPKFLEFLRRQFKENHRSGEMELPATEFVELLSQHIPYESCMLMYQKIDVNDDGVINFSEFVNYLIISENNEYGDEKEKSKISQVTPHLMQQYCQDQDMGSNSIHKTMIDFLCFTSKPFYMCISASRDGQIYLWNANASNLSKVASINHQDKNSVYKEQLLAHLPVTEKAHVIARGSRNINKDIWITCLCTMPDCSPHLCVGSVDNSLTVYELGTQDVCGRITELKDFPTAVTSFSLLQRTMGGTKYVSVQYIAFGDNKGRVCMLCLGADFGHISDGGSKKRDQGIFQAAIESKDGLQMCKAHDDWVTHMLYVPDINALVTSSSDGTIRLLTVKPLEVQRIFDKHNTFKTIKNNNSNNSNTNSNSNNKNIAKVSVSSASAKVRGVLKFVWSSKSRYFVSASERLLFIWDPYTFDMIGSIRLEARVVNICISEETSQIFAALADKTVYVYHTTSYELLQVLEDRNLYRPVNEISAMVFAGPLETLYTAGNRISVWEIIRDVQPEVKDEDDCIAAVLFNVLFQLIAVVTTFGSVTLYHIQTGMMACKFTVHLNHPVTGIIQVHSGQSSWQAKVPVVKHAAFDKNERRLMVATHNNFIQFWNFNSGEHLISIPVEVAGGGRSGRKQTATQHTHRHAHNKSNIDIDAISTSSDNTNSMNSNSMRDHSLSYISYEIIRVGSMRRNKKILLLGSESGKVFCLSETNGIVDPIPTSSLLRNDLEYYKPNMPETAADNGRGSKLLNPTNQKGYSSVSVLWSYLLSEKHLLVAYGDGKFIIWDLERAVHTLTLHTEPTGPLLQAMRMKGEKVLEPTPPLLFPLGSLNPTLGPGSGRRASYRRKSNTVTNNSNSNNRKQSIKNQHTSIANLNEELEVGKNGNNSDGGEETNSYSKQSIGQNKSSAKSIGSNSTTTVNNTETGSVLLMSTSIVEGDDEDVESEEEEDEEDEIDDEVNDDHAITNTNKNVIQDNSRNKQNSRNNSKNNKSTISAGLSGDNLEVLKSIAASTKRVNPVRNVEFGDLSRSMTIRKSISRQTKMLALPSNEEAQKIVASAAMIAAQNDAEFEKILEDTRAEEKARRERREKMNYLTSGLIRQSLHLGNFNNLLVSHSRFGPGKRNNDESSKNESSRLPDFGRESSRFAESSRNNFESSILPDLAERIAFGGFGNKKVKKFQGVVSGKDRDALIGGIGTAGFGVKEKNTSTNTDNDNTSQLFMSLESQKNIISRVDSADNDTEDINIIEHEQNNKRAPQSREGVRNNINTNVNINTNTSYSKVIVDVAVVLTEPRIIIGACSDKIIRFWDIKIPFSLCACKYFRDANNNTTGVKSGSFVVEETLRFLHLNNTEDFLIGVYDHGAVRVWHINRHTLLNIRATMQKSHNAANAVNANVSGDAQLSVSVSLGLSVSPLQLMYEWTAHDSPIIASYYFFPASAAGESEEGDSPGPGPTVVRNSNKPSSAATEDDVSGFLATASIDETVVLHRVDGVLVGRFGAAAWSTGETDTWAKPETVRVDLLASKFNNTNKTKPTQNQNTNNKSPRKVFVSGLKIPESTVPGSVAAGEEEGLKATHTSAQLNAYVETLTASINNKGASSEPQDKFLKHILKSHPVARNVPVLTEEIRKLKNLLK